MDRQKAGGQIVCEVVSWPHGIDVRVFLDGELRRTHLCRNLDEWLPLQDAWRRTLEAEGWTVRRLGNRRAAAEGVGSEQAARAAAENTEGPAE